MAAKKNNEKAGRLGRIGIGIAAVALLAISQAAAGPFTEVPDADDYTYDVSMDMYNPNGMNGPCLGCIDIDRILALRLRAAQIAELLTRHNAFARRVLVHQWRMRVEQPRVSRLRQTLMTLQRQEPE